MTALSEYERLEAPGLWRESAGAQRRDVIVAFGEATLMIADSRTGQPLAHWSLPAVVRRNPGMMPAILSPSPEAEDELEIDDPSMIAAVSKVHNLIEARKPHPGRLRLMIGVGALAVVLATAVFFVPGALIAHTARVTPDSKRADIGRSLLADVFRLSGTACAAPEGREALARLSVRLFGQDGGNLIVLASGLQGTRHLPGGAILIGRALVEEQTSPETVAAYVLAEAARAKASDALVPLLKWSGFGAALTLLTTGDLPQDRAGGYVEALLGNAGTEPPVATLIDMAKTAGVPLTGYAQGAGLDAAVGDALIEGDPFRAAAAPGAVLSDSDWVALQGICNG